MARKTKNDFVQTFRLFGVDVEPLGHIQADGRLFRTQSFRQNLAWGSQAKAAESEYDITQYLTASQRPNGLWIISAVENEKDLKTGKPKSHVTKKHDGLSYYQALYYCAAFEQTKQDEGYIALSPEEESLGLRYYKQFARAESQGQESGFIFDDAGMPAETLHGMPFNDGAFDAEAMEEALTDSALPKNNLRRSWQEQLLNDIVPDTVAPNAASLETFISKSKEAAHIETIMRAIKQIEASLLHFSTYFDNPETKSVDAFLDTVSVQKGIKNAFTEAAAEGQSRKDQLYERIHHDYKYDLMYRHRRWDEDRKPEYEAYLNEDDHLGLLKALHAEIQEDKGRREYMLNHSLTSLISIFERDTRATRKCFDDAMETLETEIAALTQHQQAQYEFERFRKLADFTFKLFITKAFIADIKALEGRQRLSSLSSLSKHIETTREAFRQLTSTTDEDMDRLDQIILSDERPSIPLFFSSFIAQFEHQLAGVQGYITPESSPQTQLELDLTDGYNGITKYKEPREFMEMLHDARFTKGREIHEDTARKARDAGLEAYRKRQSY